MSKPIALAQYFCTSATVANLVATGTSLKWYTVATGGTPLASTTALSTGNYYVSQTINSIESGRTLISVTVYSNPVAKAINIQGPSGSAKSPICTSDIKVLTLKPGYSATTITWEVAVMPLNSITAPVSSDYVTINGVAGPICTMTNASLGKNYFRARFMNGDCDATAEYSMAVIIYYKDCASAKISAVSYPNPYIDTFKLSVSTPTDGKIVISIYDMIGKLMLQRDTTFEEINDLQLGEQFPSGIYNVIINNQDGNSKTLRVIKR